METTQKVLSAESGISFLLAFVPYIISIFRRENPTRPMKVTWFIWATLDTITLIGMWKTSTLNCQIVAAVSGAWIVAALAIIYGQTKWSRIDTACSIGGAIGISLMAFGIPTLGILASVSSVFIASIPTFESVWKNPSKEDGFSWLVYWLSCYAAMHAIPAFTLADVAQPLCFFCIESIMLLLLFVKPWLLKRQSASDEGLIALPWTP